MSLDNFWDEMYNKYYKHMPINYESLVESLLSDMCDDCDHKDDCSHQEEQESKTSEKYYEYASEGLAMLSTGMRVAVNDGIRYKPKKVPVVQVTDIQGRFEFFDLDCIPEEKTESYIPEEFIGEVAGVNVVGYKGEDSQSIDYIRAIDGDISHIEAHLSIGQDVPFSLEVKDLGNAVGYFMDVPTDVLKSPSGETIQSLCECVKSCDKPNSEKIVLWNKTLDEIMYGAEDTDK